MAENEKALHPSFILAELKKNNVSHVVWLPDSETSFMYQLLKEEPTIDIVPVCREGEAMAIALGLWIGGKVPICQIQSTGFYESGDSIRGLVLDLDFPLVMLIGYRGYSSQGTSTDSAAIYMEQILRAWGIKHYLIETAEDCSKISAAFQEAQQNQKPVAVLVGAEYSS